MEYTLIPKGYKALASTHIDIAELTQRMGTTERDFTIENKGKVYTVHCRVTYLSLVA